MSGAAQRSHPSRNTAAKRAARLVQLRTDADKLQQRVDAYRASGFDASADVLFDRLERVWSTIRQLESQA